MNAAIHHKTPVGGQVSLRGAAGFTLVETLVALFIFSVLGVLSLQVLRSFLDGQQAIAFSEKALSEVQLSGTIMAEDFAAAVMRPVRTPFGGVTPVYFRGGDQPLGLTARDAPLVAFTRGGHAAHAVDARLPAVQSVEYWLKDGVFLRRTTARPDATDTTPILDQPLLADVANVRVRFQVEGSWVDSVEYQLGVRQRLPELVEWTFDMGARGTLVRLYSVGANS